MNDLLQQNIDKLLEKFQRMDMFAKMGDDDSAIKILDTIEEYEIMILESLGKSFTEMASNIRELKNEKELSLEE